MSLGGEYTFSTSQIILTLKKKGHFRSQRHYIFQRRNARSGRRRRNLLEIDNFFFNTTAHLDLAIPVRSCGFHTDVSFDALHIWSRQPVFDDLFTERKVSLRYCSGHAGFYTCSVLTLASPRVQLQS